MTFPTVIPMETGKRRLAYSRLRERSPSLFYDTVHAAHGVMQKNGLPWQVGVEIEAAMVVMVEQATREKPAHVPN